MAVERIVGIFEKDRVDRSTYNQILSDAGFQTISGSNRADITSVLDDGQPNLYILGKIDDPIQLAVVSLIRSSCQTPILCIGQNKDPEGYGIAELLKSGADGYITRSKAISPRILVAFATRIIQREIDSAEPAFQEPFANGNLTIDDARHIVKLDGKPIHLTVTEYNLLLVLSSSCGEVVTRRVLASTVWGTIYHKNIARALNSQVYRLREKLSDDPEQPTYIKTEFGVGFRMPRIES